MEHAIQNIWKNALNPLLPGKMTMPEIAFRFTLSNPDVGTTIPGMRKQKHVAAICQAAIDLGFLPPC